ncbi:MAG: sensor histidine kinase [Allosphingosinicella sp.]|uniref:sensor histidine kinase n=1 Tax=Allosphingosinicella sp. TaxID=2823234 RepID=UPI003937DAB9
MRFNDMIATVLAQPMGTARERDAKWRQLVDLLAQRRERGGDPAVECAFAYLRYHRDEVPIETRRQSARALAGLRIDPLLLRFFAEDHPSVCAPLFRAVRLSSPEWVEILPELGPTARSLLRHRRDLGPDVVQALAAFGPTDFRLGRDAPAVEAAPAAVAAPPTPSVPDAGAGGEAQIRELVARIEAFRRQRAAAPRPAPVHAPAPVAAPAGERVEAFRWETGTDGILIWVEGAPRGPLVGLSIAAIAERGQHGVDGQAAGAFERRAPFRDARFSIPGEGPAAGDWRISGVPFFDPARGNFLGFRGTGRRPRLDEVARSDAAGGLFGTSLEPDSLRQLIHELRTPLNAILGFAEMIDGQYMGPAADGYRHRAVDIIDQARRLLSAVDDLDTAARLESRRLELGEGAVDAVALLCRLHDSYERIAQHRGAALKVEIARDLPPAMVEPEAAERMFARLLAATIGLAEEGETLTARMEASQCAGRQAICLSVERPRAVSDLDEAALLDPGYSPEGDWPAAPALGLGFALRLVRNLAEASGGGLDIAESRFSLHLPALLPDARAGGTGEEGTA